MSPADVLRPRIDQAVRRLLNEQNRDPYAPTLGCFDRRYWAWKLVDFPEATFQRNVHPLAMLYADAGTEWHDSPVLREGVLAGLRYAAAIQHADGSFDQAFPHEHSFGATAFLLHSLLEAFNRLVDEADQSTRSTMRDCLRRAADFLCRHDETHGHIANHLAGAALALMLSARTFAEPRYQLRGEQLLERVLRHQSAEGWFLEYQGADPGYQTLCLYYLAHVYQERPEPELRQALRRAIALVAWCVHPDGSFAGEYGSRRTAVFYPGGLALLSAQFPLARSIWQAMLRAIDEGRTTTILDIDMGNMAPLLSNYVCAAQAPTCDEETVAPVLPCDEMSARHDFPDGGLYFRGTPEYYAALGVSNGGVLKVFDKRRRRCLWDDGGYVAQVEDGTLITTQATQHDGPCEATDGEITLDAAFRRLLHSNPTPFRFLLLRLLNLTLMRHAALGNLMKAWLVRLLISEQRPYPMQIKRRVCFEPQRVVVEDHLSKSKHLRLNWLVCGQRFVSIHMASARYFAGEAHPSVPAPRNVDVSRFNEVGQLDVRSVIEANNA